MNRMFLLLVLLFVLVPPIFGADRTYVRIQSTEYPITQNVIVILSPFFDPIKHEVIDTIEVSVTIEDSTKLNYTERIIKSLMQKAASLGANAITKLDIGSFVAYGRSDFEDTTKRVHKIYGRAIAIKILPAKSN